ncbi:DEAD/DEAH box helicase [Ottowia sp.]|uniref:DEAD/DEAH box helicase n=1 Tax=Ottowia sp. TaxID=1898956 RepID=UPI0025EBF547|nr:DEAD/DEAH box helicase [Ottowia sp.]MBK6616437.1 DEAD/DEAH box helicase [Ottowia sp.]
MIEVVAATQAGSADSGAAPVAEVSYSASQGELLRSGLLQQSALLHVCTSWGKTWMARVAIRECVARGFKAVYLCPLRALARELASSWKNDFVGAKLGLFTGELGTDEVEDNPRPEEADILIATPEKMDWYVRGWESSLAWLGKVDLLVVDELHNVGGGARGATLEGVIGRFRAVNPYCRTLSLSATLGNPQELAKWLDAALFESNERPVSLTWRIETFKSQESKQAIVLDECKATAGQGAQTIVFVQSRPRAQSLSDMLNANGLRCMPHHAGLSRSSRERAEQSFRGNELDVIVATATLSQGINMPARKVVVYDLTRWEGGGWTNLSTNEVWQLAGRAGRRGLDTSGEAVLVSPKWDQTSARQYIRGKFDAIASQVHARKRSAAEQTMVVYGSRLAGNEAQAARVMGRMLLGQSLDKHALKRLVDESTSEMIRAGMLSRDDGGVVRATRLGRIAVRFQLGPRTVISWAEFVAAVPEPCLLDILLVACASEDFNGRMRCEREEVERIQVALDSEPMALRALTPASLGRCLASKGKDLAGAARTAIALRAWSRLGDMDDAADLVGGLSHEVDECRKEALRMLHAMRAMVTSLSQSQPAETGGLNEGVLAKKLAALTSMVSVGMDGEEATLAMVEGVGPVLARRLVDAGIGDIEALAQADTSMHAVIQGVSKLRFARWIDEATTLLAQEGGAFAFREVAGLHATVSRSTSTVASGLDYFRWKRAATLEVDASQDGAWLVSGGSSPHRLHLADGTLACDCADAAKGRLCKHQIAVRHLMGDPLIPRFDVGWGHGDIEGLSLAAAWEGA